MVAGEQSLKFSQSLNYKNTISYSGRLRHLIPASMTLAVTCNQASQNFFQDLSNVNEPCITPAKADEFQRCLTAEITKNQPLLDRIYNRYIFGEISYEQYDRAMRIINGLSFRETMMFVPTAQSFMTSIEDNLPIREQGFALGLSDSEIHRILEDAIKLQQISDM